MTACTHLGFMWLQGDGGPQDTAKALNFFKKACDGGEAMGCTGLGILWYMGEGGPQDQAKACGLLKKACDDGVESACNAFRTYECEGN